MYTVKDASVAFSLMEQRLQPTNTLLLLDEYFTVCKLYGDSSVARETHQRYVTQVENMRNMLSSQTLRNSEREALQNVSARATATSVGRSSAPNAGLGDAVSGGGVGSPSAYFAGSTGGQVPPAATAAAATAGRAATISSPKLSSSADAGVNGEQAELALPGSPVRSPPFSAAAAANTEDENNSSTSASPRNSFSPVASPHGSKSSPLAAADGLYNAASTRRGVSSAHALSGGRTGAAEEERGAGATRTQRQSTLVNATTETNVRNAASYAILRREWGHENYEEQFHKPWNAFLRDLSGVMTEVVTAWVSDLDECTPYSQHLVRRSSTCCYDAAHGMCLLRWNTMREVRAYVDALHAVVNAPLSAFFVPLTLGMQVLGVPVLCMSLAPVTGPWQGWDSVAVVWHSFCGLCANLRLMRPLDRAEGGRSEAGSGTLLGGLAGSSSMEAAGTSSSPHAAMGVGGLGNALDGSVAWSLLRQLEPATAGNEYYSGGGGGSGGGGFGAAPMSSFDTNAHHYVAGASSAWEQRRHSVFYGEPTSLANSTSGRVDRVSRQVLAAAAAGRGGPFARSGGLQLTPAIGADARWYFIDARAICLYQWYARSSWMAARVPRREMFQSESGCVQRSVGPNKLILQSKLRIMVGQLLNGLLRFSSTSTSGGGLATILLNGTSSSAAGGPMQRGGARGKPPVLLSTLCHSHGVRYGTYVYAIIDLLRTEETSLDEAVQTAYRLGSSAPNKVELLKQCRRCIQAVVGELLARAIKHLIYQEWHVVMRQSPDWLHRFHSLSAAVAEAEAVAEEAAAEAVGAAAGEAVTTATVAPTAARKDSPPAPTPKSAAHKSATSTETGESTIIGLASTVVEAASKADDGAATPSHSDPTAPVEQATAPSADGRGTPRQQDGITTDDEEKETASASAEATDAHVEDNGAGADAAADDEEEEQEDELGNVPAAVRQRRLRAFIAETRESLGAPLIEAVRRVLNGVFSVNMSGSGGGGASSTYTNSPSVDNTLSGHGDTFSTAGTSLEQDNSSPTTAPPVSNASGTFSAAGVSIADSSNRYMTDEAGRSLATSSAQALGGYPVFNQQLSAVAFRSTMFEELLLAVNEQYVVQPYSGNEKMSEWQLLHKRAPVVARRSQFARSNSSVIGGALSTSSAGSAGGNGTGVVGGGVGGAVNGGGNGASGNSVSGSGGGGTGGGASGSGGTVGTGLGGAGGGGGGGVVSSGSASVGGGGAGGVGSGSGPTGTNNNANSSSVGDSWSGRGNNGRAAGLSGRSASAPPSTASTRGRPASRLRGAIPVYYPAADEESIQVDPKELFPGWSLQCLEEMIGVPLVLRQNRVDVDSSFTGAAILESLSPSLVSAAQASPYASSYVEGRLARKNGMTAAGATRPPLTSGCPLRSAVWGTTLELPLCLHSGSVEGALEYAQHQREIGMAIVSSGLSAPFIGQGRNGASSTFWRERNPHLVYMGKLIQLHAADVRIACRGWPIMEDFDFIKHSEQQISESMLSGTVGRTSWPRRRSMEAPLAHRQNMARMSSTAAASVMAFYGSLGSGKADTYGGVPSVVGGEWGALAVNTEEARTAMCFNASMHARLSKLNALVDLHEAMSSMWHLTECMESMSSSHVVSGYLLRQKIEVIATIAAQFTATGVTTALEAAVADLDVLTGGIFNFSSLDDSGERGGRALFRSTRDDAFIVNGFGRRVARGPGSRSASRSATGSGDRRARAAMAVFRGSTTTASGGVADVASVMPGTPDGSQAPTLEPAQRLHSNDNNSVVTGTDGSPMVPQLSVDRLRSVPPPPPITQRQVAVVAAAARRAGAASREVPNPLSLNTPLLDTTRPSAAANNNNSNTSAVAAPLVGSIGAFKSFILRSVQCVDLYVTLLELLTRHMLLPDAHRTPKESLSRAVMFCSLRRELIVMTHGENSVEAAMAASDVGLLLLQSPKTWPQAKTEFYRARRSLAYHLRELTDDGVPPRAASERQLATSSAAFDPSLLITQFSSSTFAQEGRISMSMHESDRLHDAPTGLHGLQRAVAASTATTAAHTDSHGRRGASSPLLEEAMASSPHFPHSKSNGRHAWTYVSREVWSTAPDRLKQALCSVLNNIAYLFCRQAQRQYLLNQQSMTAFVRTARRQNTLHRPSTGMQLYERRMRRAAKVDHFLSEAAATLQGVLHHACDIPAYDYAVALNNQASVLLHRYQYSAARRLLLQSLRITLQLQSLSVAPITLPASLATPIGTSEPGSVLWLLEPAQLFVSAGISVNADNDDGDDDQRAGKEAAAATTMEGSRSGGGGSGSPGDVLNLSVTPHSPDAPASPTQSRQRAAPAITHVTSHSSPTFADASPLNTGSANMRATTRGQSKDCAARQRQRGRTPQVPNALTVIAGMLTDLGAPLDEESRSPPLRGSDVGGLPGYYYTTSAFSASDRDSLRGVAATTTTSSAAALPASSPITVSSAEQLRNCQVHTLRMLYQLEVKKSFIERLRVQHLFQRYLAAWRARRQERRAKAAAQLYRFGVAAMTRVFLARRYRFSGYHWWLRQPQAIRRHLDPLLDQQALTTRRQLWDVWNTQVETAARLLQRVLRAAAVRKNLGAQFQFQQFYFQRCRPAVEEAVWGKMDQLYTSVMLHLHVQEGLRRMASFTEAVRSGTMWIARLMEPLLVQQEVRRIDVALHELQKREALERDFYKVLARQRLNQLQVAQMKESVLLVIRSPRPSLQSGTHAEAAAQAHQQQLQQQQQQQQQPQRPRQESLTAHSIPVVPPLSLAKAVQKAEAEAAANARRSPAASAVSVSALPLSDAHPSRYMDSKPSGGELPPVEVVPGSTVQLMTSPLSDPNIPHLGSDNVVGVTYTPPAVFNSVSPIAAAAAAAAGPVTRTASPRLAAPTSPLHSSAVTPQASTPVGEMASTTSFSGFSRSRRTRQVVIQADTADLDAEATTVSPRTTPANEERYRQMQRQYREDERAKMSQLFKHHHTDGGGGDVTEDEASTAAPHHAGTGSNNSSGTVSGRDERAGKLTSPLLLLRRDGTEEKAAQDNGSGGSGGKYSPVTVNTDEANTKWRQAMQRVAEPRTSLSLRSGSPFDHHAAPQRSPSPHPPENSVSSVHGLVGPPRAGEGNEAVALPGSVVAVLPAPSSPAPSSPAVSSVGASSASSRVAVAAAEAQRNQLLHASQLLLQFWWTKRAVPTFVTTSAALHRLYNEHCLQLHAMWCRRKWARWQVRLLVLAEAQARYAVWQEESVETASLLLLQVHNARCCRDVEAYGKWLRTTATTEERRGRAAVLLAAAALERRTPHAPSPS